MSYSNYIIDFTLTQVGTPTEAITLSQAKAYCRVTGISDDQQIELLIKRARQVIETATGLSLILKTADVWFSNFDGKFELPFGPLVNVPVIQTEQGTVLTSSEYTLIGGEFPKLTRPTQGNLKATYRVGYANVPYDLVVAMLDQISYDYENRGLDSDTGICEKSWKACQRWTRISPIL